MLSEQLEKLSYTPGSRANPLKGLFCMQQIPRNFSIFIQFPVNQKATEPNPYLGKADRH